MSENKLKPAKMMISRNAKAPRDGAGAELPVAANSRRRNCVTSLLICAALVCSEKIDPAIDVMIGNGEIPAYAS